VRQLGESLARLHAIDPASVKVPLRVREFPGPPAVAALGSMRAAVDELPLRRPALELGLKWLERRLPDPPEHETIVHSDTRNGNLIIGEDGLRAVLDWEGTLASGDPMQDLAWPSLRMWRFRNDTREIGGFAGREAYIEGYEGAGGTFDAARFHWWKVEGTLRWGVGLAGQTMGFLEGRVPSIVMAASGRRVPELEWDLLMLIRP
jgi:aminoglycoside phosphotransferase (APT) family kinase protein